MTGHPHQNQQALLEHQYADSGNLSARANLHERFSTNKAGWHPWTFDQYEFPARAHLLELGCGPAWTWRHNQHRIPAGWHITLTDFSPGMVAEAHAALQNDARFAFKQCDAQALPFDDAAFDGVIANHMLYHVPDIAQAVREVHRVLKPGGLFYAATNGERHLQEIHTLGRRFAPGIFEKMRQEFKANPFRLEDGAQVIEEMFPQVEKRLYEDALVVTEVEPLVAYMLSMALTELKTEDRVTALRELIAEEMSATGAIMITKDSGIFIARKV